MLLGPRSRKQNIFNFFYVNFRLSFKFVFLIFFDFFRSTSVRKKFFQIYLNFLNEFSWNLFSFVLSLIIICLLYFYHNSFFVLYIIILIVLVKNLLHVASLKNQNYDFSFSGNWNHGNGDICWLEKIFI